MIKSGLRFPFRINATMKLDAQGGDKLHKYEAEKIRYALICEARLRGWQMCVDLIVK